MKQTEGPVYWKLWGEERVAMRPGCIGAELCVAMVIVWPSSGMAPILGITQPPHICISPYKVGPF